jgi:hypothetical protein
MDKIHQLFINSRIDISQLSLKTIIFKEMTKTLGQNCRRIKRRLGVRKTEQK